MDNVNATGSSQSHAWRFYRCAQCLTEANSIGTKDLFKGSYCETSCGILRWHLRRGDNYCRGQLYSSQLRGGEVYTGRKIVERKVLVENRAPKFLFDRHRFGGGKG